MARQVACLVLVRVGGAREAAGRVLVRVGGALRAPRRQSLLRSQARCALLPAATPRLRTELTGTPALRGQPRTADGIGQLRAPDGIGPLRGGSLEPYLARG